MDIGPAILILPRFCCPIMAKLGVRPVHFGIIMIYNTAIVPLRRQLAVVLYVGASVGGSKLRK